jgi:hypothetical protein
MDESALLGEAEEMVRRNDAAHRMAPPDKCLDPGNFAEAAVDLRLIFKK